MAYVVEKIAPFPSRIRISPWLLAHGRSRRRRAHYTEAAEVGFRSTQAEADLLAPHLLFSS